MKAITHIILLMELTTTLMSCPQSAVQNHTALPALLQELHFIPDPDPDRVKTVLFASIPPDYLADRAEFFAHNGMDGFMMADIMASWQDNVWQQPTRYTPNAPKGKIVGEANPLLQKCRHANERCQAVGIRYNSIKVAFYKKLPDWFDDAAWHTICENLHQCAVFGRMGQFGGISLDIEYIAEMYKLDYPAYQIHGYPRDQLRQQAQQRGYEIMIAMLNGFPDMIFWLLPEGMSMYGPLASDLFNGMVKALAEKNAPGGIHVCTEGTYQITKPRSLLGLLQMTDTRSLQVLRESGDAAAIDYWLRRGSISPGLWPLGYYRDIHDATGKLLGYAGKKEQFGDKIIGSYSDKSENYTAPEFQRQFASGRSIARNFIWIYCHGQVFWQMKKQEMERYHAAASDTLPVVRNLDEYLAVMRDKKILLDDPFNEISRLVREHKATYCFEGFAPSWRHAGPFAFDQKNFQQSLAPEEKIDFKAGFQTLRGPRKWRTADADSTGYVDLAKLYGNNEMPLAYSVAWMETPIARTVQIGFGCNDCATVFVNGQKVFHFEGSRNAVIDDDIFSVPLPAGRSQILVKCGDRGGSNWGFYLRITNEKGKKLTDLHWVEPR